MQKHFFREFRNLVWWSTLLIGVAIWNLWIVVANYTACLQSFEMLNFEKKSLAEDELFGLIFRVFAPNATIAHLLAGAFEVGIALGLWFVVHLALRVFQMIKDRVEYKSIGDLNSVTVITRRAWFTLAELFVVCIPLGWSVSTVVDLFRYRVMVQNKGFSDAVKAVQSIKVWALERQDNGQLFAYSFADHGIWGLLAMTMLAGLCLELIWHRAEEAGVRLFSTTEEPEADSHQQEEVEPQPEVDANRPPEGTKATEDSADTPDQPASSAGEPVDVIGGKPGERVTLDAAKTRPDRYWIDPETREVWDATYREELFGGAKAHAAGASS